jgi:cell wall-associated NlpC family hydrolase
LQGIGASSEEILAPSQMAISFKSRVAAHYWQNAGVSEIPSLPQVILPDNRRFLVSLPSLQAPQFPWAAKLEDLLTPAAVPQKRLEPPNLWDRVLTSARHYLHTPYRLGSSLRSGRTTDCSGFVQYVYQKCDIDLPRSSASQARLGKVAARTMDFAKLRPGDLLFFSRGGKNIGHVGIYLGEGEMIHASTRRRGVSVTNLRQPYYEASFVVAKRVL